MNVLVLHGYPGVGKFTIGKILGEKTGYKLFHNHIIVDAVQSLFEFGTPSLIQLREKFWLEMIEEALKVNLNGIIFTFVFEQTVQKDFLNKLAQAVTYYNGEISFIELICEKAELEKRIVSSDRKQFTKIQSTEVFRNLLNTGALLKPDIPKGSKKVFTIDTTHATPEESANKIIQLITT